MARILSKVSPCTFIFPRLVGKYGPIPGNHIIFLELGSSPHGDNDMIAHTDRVIKGGVESSDKICNGCHANILAP